MRGNQEKSVYWAVVNQNMTVIGDKLFKHPHQADELCYKKNSYSDGVFKVMKVTLMGKPKNWKKS